MQNFISAEIWTMAQTSLGCVVFLRPIETDLVVPVIMGRAEFNSIVIGKEKIKTQRPLTHDLFLNLLKPLDMDLKHTEIHNIINEVLLARIFINTNDKSNSIKLDCRPSDAIALAVRKECPILLSSIIIKKFGISLDYFMEETEKSKDIENIKLNNRETYHELVKKLNQAIEAEEYERAAKIRDLLIRLDNV